MMQRNFLDQPILSSTLLTKRMSLSKLLILYLDQNLHFYLKLIDCKELKLVLKHLVTECAVQIHQ